MIFGRWQRKQVKCFHIAAVEGDIGEDCGLSSKGGSVSSLWAERLAEGLEVKVARALKGKYGEEGIGRRKKSRVTEDYFVSLVE